MYIPAAILKSLLKCLFTALSFKSKHLGFWTYISGLFRVLYAFQIKTSYSLCLSASPKHSQQFLFSFYCCFESNHFHSSANSSLSFHQPWCLSVGSISFFNDSGGPVKDFLVNKTWPRVGKPLLMWIDMRVKRAPPCMNSSFIIKLMFHNQDGAIKSKSKELEKREMTESPCIWLNLPNSLLQHSR